MNTLKISELKNGQIVRYRIGHHTDGPAPIWGPWIKGPVYVARRERPLAKKLHSRTRAPNVGDILTLCPTGVVCAEFSQGDFDPAFNTFNSEDWLFEIEGLTA